MTERIYAAVDLEMTGLKPGFDEIIEVGVIRCTPERVLDSWQTLVRPMEMPPLRVQRMTGITPEMLESAPAWDQVEGRLRELLDGATLLGHNIGFDESFLDAAGITPTSPSVDTLPLAQILDPAAPSHRLGELCLRYGIPLDDAHRALADAEACRQLFLSLGERFAEHSLDARDALAEISSTGSFFWQPGRVLRDWERLTPRVQPPGKRRTVGPSIARSPDRVELPSGSLASLTEAAFASLDDDEFEHRPEQLEMARDVAETLQHGGTLIVEAGTGTGKSLAYLVPAALWALKTGSTVIVSTHTINLQQQLVHKDIEFARRLIAGVSEDASDALLATVVKGRDNYLCQQKLDLELGRCADWEDPLLLARAAVWRSGTEQGDRAELRLPAPMVDLWPKLSAGDTRCLSDRSCEYANDGSCFLLRVQRQAAASHIVIANHALLVRALVNGAITMPDGAVAIIDEAHALEDVATDQLSLAMNEGWMMETVVKVAHSADSLAAKAEQVGLDDQSTALTQSVARSEMSLAKLFEDVAAFVSEYADDRMGNQDRVTLSPGARNSRAWSDVEIVWEGAHEDLILLSAEVKEVADRGRSEAAEYRGDEEQQLLSFAEEADLLVTELNERMNQLNRAVTEHSEDIVAWATRETRKSERTSVHAAPLSVADYLRPLWQDRHAAVLTGATLAASPQEADFGYLRERLGINDAAEAQYGSPFDYERRCRIYLPGDILDADNPEHHDSVADAVVTLAAAADGRTMVLFRSYSAMNQVARRAQERLEQEGLVLLRQGRDGSAAAVVEALRRDSRSVLFGVNALWTGVDVPGDALSLLIVTRLPFAPPYDPVLHARGEQYENEFMQFTLPAAILQFRQGVGRLVRTQSDIGAIALLDGRIVSRRYGQQFIKAMPPAPLRQIPSAAVANELREFLPRPDGAA
ncbi:MAG: DEAD/DEAH box helicase [Chloroflexi bacterium]|nr:DEAD/DEAH box helicase [Chloroflexota bacterium]MYI04907.1 DEAD/DEAH box helicase [Chloroflexota bacterium]